MDQSTPDRDDDVGQRERERAKPPAALALFGKRRRNTPTECTRAWTSSPDLAERR
jgi:hypothetical protein